MAFLGSDFMLRSPLARRLYHDVAEPLPIYDYHGHLSPQDLAHDRTYANLYEIWLASDHYKWRALRAAGVDEERITGNADPYDKYMAWAATVPQTIGNPLHHWTHLELRRYFGIELLLSPQTAAEIWTETQRQLATLSSWEILRKFRVALVGTTDDPADDLSAHKHLSAQNPLSLIASRSAPRRDAISQSRPATGTEAIDSSAEKGLQTQVYPSFRPDRAMLLGDTAAYRDYLQRLGATEGILIDSLDALQSALKKAHTRFHALGSRISDHGISSLSEEACSRDQADVVFQQAFRGEAVSPESQGRFVRWMMRFTAGLDAEQGWTQQLHLGAHRNANTRLFRRLGPDAGGDCIGDFSHGAALCSFLDELDQHDQLPKTILYNIHPADNYLFATIAGTFQRGPTRGKIQWGSGWWFLDQRDGIRWQLKALSQLGLLSTFVGMLTDSRSMMSFPRHEYFRRVLCDYLGNEVQAGLIPDDWDLLSELVAAVCFGNAARYFQMQLASDLESWSSPRGEIG